MNDRPSPERMLEALRQLTLVQVPGSPHCGTWEPSLRELAVFLICYLENGWHTGKRLSARLNVPQCGVTRALDALGRHGLVKRKCNPRDHRSIIARRTSLGMAVLADLSAMVAEERQANHHVRNAFII
jgi:DNA-binding transcriptional ArsR family regulator